MIENLSQYFDHTNLRPDAVETDIIKLCEDAKEYQFYSVCVNPFWVKLAKEFLQGSSIKICTVAGFPLGANLTNVKIKEATQAVSHGADEIDIVANIGRIKSSEYTKVEAEIKTVREALSFNIILKVIVETSLLTKEEQTESTKTVINGGAQFIKTSTGFFGGAAIGAVENLSLAAKSRIKIKASGGIKSPAQCEALIKAGAHRLGSSASVEIIKAHLL